MDRKHKKKKGNTGPVYRIAAAAGLLLASTALLVTAARVPGTAEWYSEHIYPLLVNSIGRVSGQVPFSVSETAIYILLILFFATLARMIFRALNAGRRKNGMPEDPGKSPAAEAVSWMSGVLLAAGILIFLYTVCCGINYHRVSFSEKEGIITYRYSADELRKVCVRLTQEVNSLAEDVKREENGLLQLESSEKSGAVGAMERLAETFPSLEGFYPFPKELIVSEVLSYQGLTGIYLPFTVEANYNGDMPAYDKPFTACHELSHLRGFMQEVRPMLSSAAEPDLAANNDFWDRYEGIISESADQVNDAYLKANGQADGVQSYSRMTDLIVAYYGEGL